MYSATAFSCPVGLGRFTRSQATCASSFLSMCARTFLAASLSNAIFFFPPLSEKTYLADRGESTEAGTCSLTGRWREHKTAEIVNGGSGYAGYIRRALLERY